MKYEEAIKRLEEIVSEIEGGKLDMDKIGESLKEARELIKFCKDKLYKTDEEITFDEDLVPGGRRLSGWIVVDFASAPLAEHIYEFNFR